MTSQWESSAVANLNDRQAMSLLYKREVRNPNIEIRNKFE
jgi:hypothetical protein